MTSDRHKKKPETESEPRQILRGVMCDASERVSDSDVVRDENQVKWSPEDHRQDAQDDGDSVPNVKAEDAKQESNGVPPNIDEREDSWKGCKGHGQAQKDDSR